MALTDKELQDMEGLLKKAFKTAFDRFNRWGGDDSEHLTAIGTTAQALLTVDREIRERAEFKRAPLAGKEP